MGGLKLSVGEDGYPSAGSFVSIRAEEIVFCSTGDESVGDLGGEESFLKEEDIGIFVEKHGTEVVHFGSGFDASTVIANTANCFVCFGWFLIWIYFT